MRNSRGHVIKSASSALILLLSIVLLSPGAAVADVPRAGMPEVQGPRQLTAPQAKKFDLAFPGHAPAQTNDFLCRPDAQKPHPVLLAHGTDASAYADYARLAPFLRDHGYCVFALNYGLGKPGINFSPATGLEAPTYGTTDMRESAKEVARAVALIRSATRAEKVHLIGFSQGANVTRYYVNKLGGATYTASWVGIASPSYGTQAPPGVLAPQGASLDQILAPALVQQLAGSEFLTELNTPRDTVPGVRYTTIGTRYDEVITPGDNGRLRGENARNHYIQDFCMADMSGHFQLPYSPLVAELVLAALDEKHALRHECSFVPPGVGLLETIIANNF
ncbi:alpha/beta fold hydrolase [Hoyosella sp. YIM 151337]|uniref:esterase/lipase family protein n=1 Tax=Hoyosella sp. YIM 151337 TaxID=2992742 RepID=UPI002235E1F1|nr:alpha/beta fold hydrolase [Hoyosella sp. YIM 151337]MCW4353200.1 alpha/beta fold hydrolase [Hoyosella sp. YIM 151337]